MLISGSIDTVTLFCHRRSKFHLPESLAVIDFLQNFQPSTLKFLGCEKSLGHKIDPGKQTASSNIGHQNMSKHWKATSQPCNETLILYEFYLS